MKFARHAALLTIALVACSPAEGGDEAEYVSNVTGIDRRNFDESISPCVDFYQYANGGWFARNPIPDDRPGVNGFSEIQDRNREILKTILEEAAESSQRGEANAVVGKVGAFFSTAMDEGRMTELGTRPLDEELDLIAGITTPEDVTSVVADFHRRGRGTLFNTAVMDDMQKTDEMLFYAMQGGLGLPEKDYYFRDRDAETRSLYVAHVARMLRFVGEDEATAAADAATIMEMETALAEASLSRVEMRNPATRYRPVSVAQAMRETPNLQWDVFLDDLGITVDTFSFPQPDFFAAVNAMLTERPVEDWQAYLRWNLINSASPYLSPEIQQADFDFYSTTLSGTEQMEDVWKRALQRTDGSLGEALGELYVARAFPPATKARADRMIEDLREALRNRIASLEWMGDATKARAFEKLAAFTPKIGYPDRWKDYSSVEVVEGDHYGNIMRARGFEKRLNLEKLGHPPDRTEWGMTPPTVNAYYSPLRNEIVFPAGILQPPFFDGAADDAVNYGAMGAVIGHEMGHGFDDQGSRFDAKGNFANWWTDEDRAEFERRTAVLVEQYSAYEPLEGLFVNGELTLGENIGDLGGLLMAYDALTSALEDNPVGEIDGFTPQQRFFLSWAQAWRGNQREEQLRLQVSADPHSPNRFRTNGPLSNIPAFAAAFSCQPGDPMVRPDSLRVHIW
jgi:putative endopeptidase